MPLFKGDYTPRLKELVDIMGDRLILDGVGGFPDQARPENIMALREALDECGVT